MYGVPMSPAFDAVVAASHPDPDAGGPCASCAFRPGTEANLSPHTDMLARFCVEGVTPFNCHERPGFCRGWIAAVNLRAEDITDDEDALRYRTAMADGAAILTCVARAVEISE